MGIAAIVLGIALLICGIVQGKRSGKKSWHVLTAVGAVALCAGVVYMLCVTLLLGGLQEDPPREDEGGGAVVQTPIDVPDPEEPVGGDWRSWRGYAGDCIVGTRTRICFDAYEKSDGSCAWNVYDQDSDSGYMGITLEPEGYTAADFTDIQDCFVSEDYNGDGFQDLGLETATGDVIWYLWDDQYTRLEFAEVQAAAERG